MAAACAFLEGGARLVTLTGTGSTCKTWLALQVATELLDDCKEGAWFAGLTPHTEPGPVVEAVAGALGVRETGHEPLESTLLVDNFEHGEAVALVPGRILASCPRVRVPVTSRGLPPLEETSGSGRCAGPSPGRTTC